MLSNFEKRWQNKFETSAYEGGADWQISLWHEEGLKNYIRYFLAYSGVKSSQDNSKIAVLDAGSGPGTFSAILANKGFKVFAIDYSDEMITRAKEKTQGLVIDFQKADIYNLSFEDRYFDIVVCLGVFQTLESHQRAIEELKRVLKPNGKLVITTLNRFSLGNLKSQKDRDLGVIAYSPWQFRKMLVKTGFGNCKIKGMYFFPKRLNFLSDFIFKLRIYRIFNLLFFIFCSLSHSFYIEAVKNC